MSDKTLGVVVTPLYATSEPPTQAPMPDDRGSMRVTAVDGGITYTEGPSAYDVLLQQAQTIEELRKTIVEKDEKIAQLILELRLAQCPR